MKTIVKIKVVVSTVLLLMCINEVLAQVRISGSVANELSGEMLPGASVKVVGATIGVSTDEKGNFSLQVPNLQVSLSISYMGYLPREIKLNNRSALKILLTPDASQLEEIVVVGYGTVKKSDITGSVTALKREDFNEGPIASADQLIFGKAAGVQVVQNSGEPGGGFSVNIRGAGSINAGNSPLYVVDGLPLDNSTVVSGGGENFTNSRAPRNPLNTINPADIESIEILKDASATAIYGSRGANGVVMITTKKGKAGRLSITYDAYGGIQNVANNIKLLNASEYQQVMNDIIDAGGGSENDRVATLTNDGTDWLGSVFRKNAPTHNHNLSFSGGNENTQFNTSFNYYSQDGLIINSAFKRYSARLNLEHRVKENFKLGVNINTSYTKDDFVPNGFDLNERAGVIYAAINYDPTLPVWADNGRYFLSPNMNIDNPLAIANGKDAFSNSYRTFGTAYAEYNFLNGFKAKINVGGDIVSQRTDTYVDRSTIDGLAAGGIGSIEQGKNSNYLGEATLSYNRSFAEHQVNAVVGMTGQKFIDDNFFASARRFSSDATGTNNLNLGDPLTRQTTSNKGINSLLSYLARINYSYKDKYLFTTAFRADGSSRFGENNRFGYFPSFALGWKIKEEDFMKSISSISSLKLRASWGRTGNQEIGNYQSLSTLSSGWTAVLDGTQVIGIAPSRIPNPNLKWESSEQVNIGIDFGLFKDRISGTIDWYKKDTKDMLLNLPVPRSSGFSTMMTNVGSVQNSGLELGITSNNMVGAFQWTTNAMFTTLRNKVKSLGGIPNIITGSAGSTSQVAIIQEGEPLNSFYGYQIVGIWQENDDFSSTVDNVQAGDFKYLDVNGDKTVNAADRVIIGKSFPDFTYSLTNNFQYKGFGLYIFIEGVQGVSMLNNNLVDTYFPPNLRRNRLAEPLLNRWTPQNPSNVYPSFVTPNTQGQKGVNNYTVEDASYIRLNTVRISYNLPIKSGPIAGATIYVSGQNLYTITDYTGFDPALNPNGGANFRMDWNAYPAPRTYLFGATLNF